MSEKSMREVIVKLPKQMVNEIDQPLKQRTTDCGEFVYISTRRYSKQHQQNHIREAMVKGYVEMSQINLTISSECSHVEYEAEHMVERLVSGG